MVAYKNTLGTKYPGVVYIGGFKSTMETSKAIALEEFCVKNRHPFVRFDYEGCGKSPDVSWVQYGRRFSGFSASVSPKMLRISEKRAIAYKKTAGIKSPGLIFLSGYMSNMEGNKATALAEFCSKNGHPLILVGSSMGGWISCLIAMEKPEKVHSLVGICPAFNFVTELDKKFGKNKEPDGSIELIGPQDNYVISKCLIDDSYKHLIDVNSPIPIHCRVRLIHGMKDTTVPYQYSIDILQQLESNDAELILRNSGDHRMSEPRDLNILMQTIESLL
uniref:Palmitoyl-protein thioesterase ABHD10, mitochondrial n=1 Tax=Strigamia maritima TaxID=126957 RepID=T1IWK9_STRMM